MEISNFYRETYDPVDSVILSGPRAEASIQPASNHKVIFNKDGCLSASG